MDPLSLLKLLIGYEYPLPYHPPSLAEFQCGSGQQLDVSTETPFLDIVGCLKVQQDFAVVVVQGGGVAGHSNFIL